MASIFRNLILAKGYNDFFMQKFGIFQFLNHCMTSILHVTYGQDEHQKICFIIIALGHWIANEAHCKFWNLVIGLPLPLLGGYKKSWEIPLNISVCFGESKTYAQMRTLLAIYVTFTRPFVTQN